MPPVTDDDDVYPPVNRTRFCAKPPATDDPWRWLCTSSLWGPALWNGTIDPSASACDRSSSDWYTASWNWVTTMTTPTLASTTWCNASSTYVGGWTTLCDGIRRAKNEEFSTTTLCSDYYSLTWDFSIPPPACTIDQKGCDSLASSYGSHFFSDAINGQLLADTTTAWDAPWCDSSPRTDCLPECYIQAHDVRLFFWPEGEGGLPCDNRTKSAITSKAEIATPLTAIVEGETLTSPTVYLSYRVVSAENQFIHSWCKVSLSNVWLPVKSEHLST
jgi:hypothetical protein